MGVDVALVRQYSDNILLLVQQLLVKVANTVFQKPDCKGEMAFQDQLASEEAEEKVSRNEVVRNNDPDYRRRKITPRYFYKAPLVDNMDKVMMAKDPTSPIVLNNAGALARAKDQVTCVAFFATAYGGKDGTTSYAWDTANQTIVHGSSGLNMDKIRGAKKKLDQKEVPMEDRHFTVSAEEIEDLLSLLEVTSSDYAQVKALVDGRPGTVCGFNFVQTERQAVSSSIRPCAAYHKTGMVLGTWLDMKASIDIMPGLHFSAQIYAGQSYGATRLEKEKVVKVECYHA